MSDNEKKAHDIAVSLLPIALKETNTNMYIYDSNGNASIDSFSINDTYIEIYTSLLRELS